MTITDGGLDAGYRAYVLHAYSTTPEEMPVDQEKQVRGAYYAGVATAVYLAAHGVDIEILREAVAFYLNADENATRQ